MKIQIKKIDFGIAFRINNKIYINNKIPKDSKLYKCLIEHELEHTNKFNLKDIKNDLFGQKLNNVKKDYYKFLLTNKKAWYQFLPIIKIEKKWVIDPIMSLIWGIMILLIAFLSKI
jgi:hypothetical protein